MLLLVFVISGCHNTTSILHVCSGQNILAKTIHHAINITIKIMNKRLYFILFYSILFYLECDGHMTLSYIGHIVTGHIKT